MLLPWIASGLLVGSMMVVEHQSKVHVVERRKVDASRNLI